MVWLGFPTEFWSAIIGAIVGGVVSAAAAGGIALFMERRRSRLEDLTQLQELVENFAYWVVEMSESGVKSHDSVDELDKESARIAFRATTLLSRLNDSDLKILSIMVFEKSVDVISARNGNDNEALLQWRDKITKACAVFTDALSSRIRGQGAFWRLAQFRRRMLQRL